MNFGRNLFIKIRQLGQDEEFLGLIDQIEGIVSKVLSLAMVVVILISVVDLIILIFHEIFNHSVAEFNTVLFELFGIFLNILIALELLENITAYLKQHVIQVELVIVTSLIAVARKIIILDFSKTDGVQLIGLAIAIFSLAVSYWIIRYSNNKYRRG